MAPDKPVTTEPEKDTGEDRIDSDVDPDDVESLPVTQEGQVRDRLDSDAGGLSAVEKERRRIAEEMADRLDRLDREDWERVRNHNRARQRGKRSWRGGKKE